MISLDFEDMLALMSPDVYAAWMDEIKLYYGFDTRNGPDNHVEPICVFRIVRRLETLRVMVLMIGNAMINVVWAFIFLFTYMAPIFFMQLTTTTPPCLKMVVRAIPLSRFRLVSGIDADRSA